MFLTIVVWCDDRRIGATEHGLPDRPGFCFFTAGGVAIEQAWSDRLDLAFLAIPLAVLAVGATPV